MNFYLRNYLKIIKTLIKESRGQKRLFISYGLINTIITNLFLQLTLSFSFISTSFATLFSQIINMIIGYIIYSRYVFKNNNLSEKIFIIRYLILSLSIWLINFCSINILKVFGIERNIGALILIPFLAITSFLAQKYYVFKNHI